MDITPVLTESAQVINGYGDGGFTITQERHEGGVIIFPTLTQPWDVASFEDITEESLQAVAEHSAEVEILLVGTGASQQFITPAFKRQCKEKWGVVIEAMDTGAACRTYNILMAEERRVAAALLPVS